MTIRRIETERLILRPLTTADAEDVFEWVGDPVVNRFMPYNLYNNVEQVKEWIAGIEDAKNHFGFELAETGKVIGSGDVGFDPERGAYGLGYNLNRAFWGRGLTTEAAKAMIQWAYENVGARDFIACHAVENPASGRVIQKCGFKLEGYGQYSRFDGSETFDAAFYSLHLNRDSER